MKKLRENILHIEDVTHGYPGITVIDNLDLSIEKGELVTILGPSGCGKSTLYRLITGQEFVSSNGSISILGKPVGFPDPQRGIVFQHYSLFEHKTVIENVMLSYTWSKPIWYNWFGSNKEEYKLAYDKAMNLLTKVKLNDAAFKKPSQLSGGMRQRVAIAQALMAKHEILLMDEPFGALDESTRRELQLYLLELWEEHEMTILFITHDSTEAGFLASRMISLSQHYTDDRGDIQRGSKVVHDVSMSNFLPARHEISYEEYNTLVRPTVEKVVKDGLDPEYLQHASTFTLNTCNSYQTLTTDERSK